MKMLLNHLILAIGVFAFYSCNTIEYNYPEEKKKLLEKILQNPDSITSIVKNSIFYDEKVVEEFYKEHSKNWLMLRNPEDYQIIGLKEIQNENYEIFLDYEYPYVWSLRDFDYKKGETYKDVEKEFIFENLYGIISPAKNIGFGIIFIKLNNKYYYSRLIFCYKDSEYLSGHGFCSIFNLNKKIK